MSEPVRVAYGLVRAASAFLVTLGRRPPEIGPVPPRFQLASVQAPAPFVQAPPAPIMQAPPIPSVQAPAPPRPVLSEGLPTAAGIDNRCPVCQARFRGSRTCSRCGADLAPLMVLAVKAWQLRQEARKALDDGDIARALRLTNEAQETQSTPSGEALRLLGTWLRAG